MSDDVGGGCGWSELESAVRGPRPDMFPHVDADCIGQFQWDDAEECYICIVCRDRRRFYEW